MAEFEEFEVVVVGAGFSGIGAAIQLRQNGIHDFIVVEKADDIGGTWRDNTYPDVGADIPSFGYCYSFEPNPDWRRIYAKGNELKAYADRCVDKYGVRQHLRLGTEIMSARFDEDRHLWQLDTSRGPLRARFLLLAYGAFGKPKVPGIPGLDAFAGTVIHSSRWDHTQAMDGRVGIIGTGSSAVQIIPAIAEDALRLHVFQRTPIWVIPKPDFPIPRPIRSLLRFAPWLLTLPRWVALAWLELLYNSVFRFKAPAAVTMLEWLARLQLRVQVRDRTVRARLRPAYRFGCKFLTLSNRYYKTFARDNVELVTAEIAAITPTGVTTTDGCHHEIDTLLLATGFEVFEPTNLPKFPATGSGGVDLSTYFQENPIGCYEGVSMPPVPNMFIIHGPYSMTGSFFVTIESAVAHAVRLILEARRRDVTKVQIRQEPYARFLREMISRQSTSIYYNSNCDRASSFYFDSFGHVPLFRPTTGVEAWWRARNSPLGDYDFSAIDQHESRDDRREAS